MARETGRGSDSGVLGERGETGEGGAARGGPGTDVTRGAGAGGSSRDANGAGAPGNGGTAGWGGTSASASAWWSVVIDSSTGPTTGAPGTWGVGHPPTGGPIGTGVVGVVGVGGRASGGRGVTGVVALELAGSLRVAQGTEEMSRPALLAWDAGPAGVAICGSAAGSAPGGSALFVLSAPRTAEAAAGWSFVVGRTRTGSSASACSSLRSPRATSLAR